jgi:preprotein translocase SecE subunit
LERDEMADKPKSKRRVKNPETFRQRALKAAEASDRPNSTHRVRQAIKSGFATLFAPIGRILGRVFRPIAKSRVFKSKPARLIGKVLAPAYFRNSFRELKLVTWPGWKQSRDLTLAVLIFAVVFGAVVAAVDYGLDKVFKNLLLK